MKLFFLVICSIMVICCALFSGEGFVSAGEKQHHYSSLQVDIDHMKGGLVEIWRGDVHGRLKICYNAMKPGQPKSVATTKALCRMAGFFPLSSPAAAPRIIPLDARIVAPLEAESVEDSNRLLHFACPAFALDLSRQCWGPKWTTSCPNDPDTGKELVVGLDCSPSGSQEEPTTTTFLAPSSSSSSTTTTTTYDGGNSTIWTATVDPTTTTAVSSIPSPPPPPPATTPPALLVSYVASTRAVLVRRQARYKWLQLAFDEFDQQEVNRTAAFLCKILNLKTDTAAGRSPPTMRRAKNTDAARLLDPRVSKTGFAQVVRLSGCPAAEDAAEADASRGVGDCKLSDIMSTKEVEKAGLAELHCDPTSAMVSGPFRFRIDPGSNVVQVAPINEPGLKFSDGAVCNSAGTSAATVLALARSLGFFRFETFTGSSSPRKTGVVFYIDRFSCGSGSLDSVAAVTSISDPSCSWDGHFAEATAGGGGGAAAAAAAGRCSSRSALVMKVTRDGLRSGSWLFKLGDFPFSTSGILRVKPFGGGNSGVYGGVSSSSSFSSSSSSVANQTAAYLCSRVFGFSTKGARFSLVSSSDTAAAAEAATAMMMSNISCPQIQDGMRFNASDVFSEQCSWTERMKQQQQEQLNSDSLLLLHLTCTAFPSSLASGFALQVFSPLHLLLVRSMFAKPLASSSPSSFGNFENMQWTNSEHSVGVFLCRMMREFSGHPLPIVKSHAVFPARKCVFNNFRCSVAARKQEGSFSFSDCTYDGNQAAKSENLPASSVSMEQLESTCSQVVSLECKPEALTDLAGALRTTLTIILIVFFISVCCLVCMAGWFGARVSRQHQEQQAVLDAHDNDEDGFLSLAAVISAQRAALAPAARTVVISGSAPDGTPLRQTHRRAATDNADENDDEGAVALGPILRGASSPSSSGCPAGDDRLPPPPVGYISPAASPTRAAGTNDAAAPNEQEGTNPLSSLL